MDDFQKILGEIWEGKRKSPVIRILFILLFLLSLPYGLVVALRNLLYDLGVCRQRKLSCPVISVGNITAGGTGKTPTVIMLAKLLKENGFRPAVLSRGYGGESRREINTVSDGHNVLMNSREVGDEPFLMAQALKGVPVITGVRRYLTGSYAVKELKADVLLLDDGFQHRALYRDLDIVLADSSRPFSNGRLLPCGRLRESLKGLRRADMIVLTGNDPDGKLKMPSMPDSFPYGKERIFRAFHKPLHMIRADGGDILTLDCLKGKKIFAFAGIGNPRSFIRTIEMLHADLTGFFPFSDHQVFSREDIETIRKRASESKAELIMTTEKDGVRLLDFPDFMREIVMLHVEMSIVERGEEFADLILSKLRKGVLQA